MQPSGQKTFAQRVMVSAVWYAIVFFVLIAISYYFELSGFLGSVLDLFSPVLLGLAFAYILNPIFRFFERRIFSRVYPSSLRRTVSLLCTYLLFILFAFLLFLLIIPQLLTAMIDFIGNYNEHINAAVSGINTVFGWLNDFFDSTLGKNDFFTPIDGTQFSEALYQFLTDSLAKIDIQFLFSAAGAFFSVITDVIFALFISLYLLSSKEKRYAQVMKVRNALFSDRTNKRITRICTTIDNLFGKFFEGRIFDSLIVGALLYLFFSLFGIPYAIILASFIAVINVIPYIGFFIGAVPATLLVILTDHEKLLPFLIILLVIFQFDTNIISPKILGNNTGVSSLCVIVAICVTGAVFGFVGMMIGVPLFATILDYGNTVVEKKLQKKRRPSDVDNYYAPDPIIDPMQINHAKANKMINRIERRALRVKKLIEIGRETEVKPFDRFCASIHEAGCKRHLFNSTSPELLTQFSVSETKKIIIGDANATFEEFKKDFSASKAKEET